MPATGEHQRITCAVMVAIAGACAEPSDGAPLGGIQITAVTTGTGADPDGYRLVLDDGPPRPLGSNETLVVAGISVGPHRLVLSGVAPPCAPAGDVSRVLTVREGETATTTFQVACAPGSGTLVVRTRSTGPDVPPGGYRLLLDGAAFLNVASSGSATTTVVAGAHTLALERVTPNCLIEGENPRTLSVEPGGEAVAGFAVECAPADAAGPGGEIAFFTGRFGGDFNPDMVLANTDGTALRRVVASPGPVAWAPDGRTIALADDPDILVGTITDAGSFAQSVVINRGASLRGLSWSPDAARLAISELPRDGSDCNEIVVTGVNGSEERVIIGCMFGDGNPAWAPDGHSLAVEAFVFSDSFTGQGVWLVDPDLEDQELSGQPSVLEATTPAWSPDGSRIAYGHRADTTADYDLFTARPDGSDPVRLTRTTGDDGHPTWSSDGARIAFVSHRDGNPEIYVVNADGSDPVRITDSPALDTMPAWRPLAAPE